MSVESSPSPLVILAENGGASSGRHSNASQRQARSTPKSQTELQYTPRLKQRHHVLCLLLVANIRSEVFSLPDTFHIALSQRHPSYTRTIARSVFTTEVDECRLRNVHNGLRRPRSVFNLGHRYVRLPIRLYRCSQSPVRVRPFTIREAAQL